MVDRNTVIVNSSLAPQTADHKLEGTTNSRSPPSQTQKCNIQEINEDNNRQTHKILCHFENCGAVYMDSFNAHDVRIENCGNNVPQVTYHRPRFISNERALHSKSHAVSDDPQNATDPPTASTEIAKSNHNDLNLQMNGLSLPQFPQPISPSHFSGDLTHHYIRYLEQLLDSSLATVAVIQFSGSTLADVLTPRAYDTFKALYAIAALDAPASSTNSRGSESPTPSTSSDIGKDCPYSSSCSPPLPNSSLAVPCTGKIHVSISVDYIMLFSLVGLAAVSCLVVFFNLPPFCERIFRM